MRLGGEVVHLVRLDFRDQRHQPNAVAQVSVVQEEFRCRVVRVHVQVVDARWMSPCTSYPLDSSNSARYDPSCPVMPVTNARLGFPLDRCPARADAHPMVASKGCIEA